MSVMYDTANPNYKEWTELVENIGRYFLSTVIDNWEKYVSRIAHLSEKDLVDEHTKMNTIDLALQSHKIKMNTYLDKVKVLRQKAVETYDNYRKTKVPYELFIKVFSGNASNEEKLIYNRIIEEREHYLEEAKKLWYEISNIQKEYKNFMNGKEDYYNSLRREKKNVQNRIDFQFKKNLGNMLVEDNEKVKDILGSENMIARFNYFFRSLCTSLAPGFFSTYSVMDREEITNYFFTMLIEKGCGEHIEFSRLLYKQDENGNFISLYSEEEIYRSFFNGYYNTIKGLLIKSMKRYQNDNIRLVRVDGINFNNENGEDGANHGYDLISNEQYHFENDVSKAPVKTDVMELVEVKECWDNFYKFIEKNFNRFVEVTSYTFYNKDKFYHIYTHDDFVKICRYIVNNLDFEIRHNMYSVKRMKAFTYSAFGGSRSRTYNVNETKVINQIITMFLCEFIYKYGSGCRIKKSSVFYDKIKNVISDGISETWRASNNIFSQKINGFIEDFEKKHDFFFEN